MSSTARLMEGRHRLGTNAPGRASHGNSAQRGRRTLRLIADTDTRVVPRPCPWPLRVPPVLRATAPLRPPLRAMRTMWPATRGCYPCSV